MKKYSFSVLIVLLSLSAYGQYGSIELNTGGFSLVPAFTDDQPNLIVSAGTSDNKRLSAHLIANIRLEEVKPRGGIFITRYKLINQRLKLYVGVHLPAFQVDENYHMDTFFAREALATYRLNESISFTGMFIRGTGMNNDFKMKLLNFMTTISKGKFTFSSQVYGMDYESTYGIAQAVAYSLSKTFTLNGFFNKTLSDGSTISTLGLKYHF